MPLLSIEKVNRCCDLEKGQIDQVDYILGTCSMDVSTLMIKISQSKDDSLDHLQKFKMRKLFMILVTLKTRSRSTL